MLKVKKQRIPNFIRNPLFKYISDTSFIYIQIIDKTHKQLNKNILYTYKEYYSASKTRSSSTPSPAFFAIRTTWEGTEI